MCHPFCPIHCMHFLKIEEPCTRYQKADVNLHYCAPSAGRGQHNTVTLTMPTQSSYSYSSDIDWSDMEQIANTGMQMTELQTSCPAFPEESWERLRSIQCTSSTMHTTNYMYNNHGRAQLMSGKQGTIQQLCSSKIHVTGMIATLNWQKQKKEMK